MFEAILVFGSIGAIAYGVSIAEKIEWDYGEIPYDGLLTGITSLFMFFAVVAKLGDSSQFWIIIWLILAILFYYLSFRAVLQNLQRLGVQQPYITYTLIGQFLLPLGTVLLLLILLALIFGGGKGKRKR